MRRYNSNQEKDGTCHNGTWSVFRKSSNRTEKNTYQCMYNSSNYQKIKLFFFHWALLRSSQNKNDEKNTALSEQFQNRRNIVRLIHPRFLAHKCYVVFLQLIICTFFFWSFSIVLSILGFMASEYTLYYLQILPTKYFLVIYLSISSHYFSWANFRRNAFRFSLRKV